MDAPTLTAWALVVTAVAAVVGAIAGPWMAWLQGRRTMEKVAIVDDKIDGPLTALVASIRAEAEVKIAIAEEATRQAFREGRERERASPVASRADVEASTKIVTEAVAALPAPPTSPE